MRHPPSDQYRAKILRRHNCATGRKLMQMLSEAWDPAVTVLLEHARGRSLTDLVLHVWGYPSSAGYEHRNLRLLDRAEMAWRLGLQPDQTIPRAPDGMFTICVEADGHALHFGLELPPLLVEVRTMVQQEPPQPAGQPMPVEALWYPDAKLLAPLLRLAAECAVEVTRTLLAAVRDKADLRRVFVRVRETALPGRGRCAEVTLEPRGDGDGSRMSTGADLACPAAAIGSVAIVYLATWGRVVTQRPIPAAPCVQSRAPLRSTPMRPHPGPCGSGKCHCN